MIGDVLWEPPSDLRESTEIGRFMTWLAGRDGRAFRSYDELWRWSVEDLEGFSGAVWDFYDLRAHTPYERVLGSRAMPWRRVVPGRPTQLRRASRRSGGGSRPDRRAGAAARTGPPIELTFGELRDRVARARAGLQRLGIGSGDRVVAYLPNIPEAVVAFAATASLGAIWAVEPTPSSACAASSIGLRHSSHG